MTQYKPTIGLEIHTALKTKTKMFCDSVNDPDEKRPNWNVCPICMGHPGTIPVINEEAVRKVILTGLALNCSIAHDTFFERKNYFYPDLPKGYQISQYQKPLCEGGYLQLITNNQQQKKFRITRIHLEEDAGRLQHTDDPDASVGAGGYSLVDYNRAGVPLMELVTEPDFTNGQDVRAFAEEFQLILKYIGASDADMEKGLMRVEVNISLAEENGLDAEKRGNSSHSSALIPHKLGTKVEIKNLNSIKAAADSVDYEIKRQQELLEGRGQVVAETRGWDENKKATFSQRSKEEAHDYRYFPEPDLPPLKIYESRSMNHESGEDGFYIDEIKVLMPELPQARRERFKKQYGLPDDQIQIFTTSPVLAGYYEHVASEIMENDKIEHKDGKSHEKEEKLLKIAANYLIIDPAKELIPVKISPDKFADLTVHIVHGSISSSAATQVIAGMLATGLSSEDIIKEKDLGQVSDSGALDTVVDAVIAANQKPVEDYKKGKEASLKFLVGMAMRESKGKANPQILEEIIRRKLGN